jgi:predicted methyltransferase
MPTVRLFTRRRFLLAAALAVAAAVGASASLFGCGGLKRFAYSGWGRDDWQQPERVVEALTLQPGDAVADLGAGGGYFTFRFADAVGPSGRVFAVDVDPDMIEYLAARAEDEGRANVEVILAAFDDPKLAPASVDLVFVANTYHHLEDRVAYFARLKPALKAPSGRVAIVELAGGGFPAGHHTDAAVIRDEMARAGYREIAAHNFLERQHFLVFALEAPER